jgi:hypothetical protein
MTREVAVLNRLELRLTLMLLLIYPQNYRRIAARMEAESLAIPKTLALRILKENSGKRKFVCTIMCPPAKLQVFNNF